jgi:hypothetical protein
MGGKSHEHLEATMKQLSIMPSGAGLGIAPTRPFKNPPSVFFASQYRIGWIVLIQGSCHSAKGIDTKEFQEGLIMESDMIVVLGLALFFFGGISYLLWKERNKPKPRAAEMQAFSQDSRQPVEKHNRKKL